MQVIDALLAAGAALEKGAGCSSALMVAVENGKLDVTSSPTIFLPEDRSKARGVEAEVTWPGTMPPVGRRPATGTRRSVPSSVSVFGVGKFGSQLSVFDCLGLGCSPNRR